MAARDEPPINAYEQDVREDYAVVEMDEEVSPPSSETASDLWATAIELQQLNRSSTSNRRPASFDAAAILQWRSQGIALPLSPSPSPSPSLESSPTLVASTASLGSLSPSAPTSVTRSKKRSATSKRRHASSMSGSSARQLQTLRIAICAATTFVLCWYLLGARTTMFWPSSLLVDSLELSRCSNPYLAPGRLDHSDRWPDATRWLPFDPECLPPPLLANLRAGLEAKPSQYSEPAELKLPLDYSQAHATTLLPLPWLVGKTVVLVGDDVERAHAKDFCRFADGQYAVIASDHPLLPRPFANGIDEKWLQTQGTMNETRPTVCFLPKYDFVLVNVFHFGLANRVEFEHESLFINPQYYPPAALRDRLDSILLPILAKLGRTKPDLVEFASGFWDLRHFSAVDQRYGQPFDHELLEDRLEWYTDRLVQALSDLGTLFPHAKLLWRPLYTINTADWAAPARSIALERLANRVVMALNASPDAAAVKAALFRAISGRTEGKKAGEVRREIGGSSRDLKGITTGFLNRVHERIGSKERVEVFTPAVARRASLHGRLAIDPWTSIVRGQEPLASNPSGYVWADIILYELWRTTLDQTNRGQIADLRE